MTPERMARTEYSPFHISNSPRHSRPKDGVASLAYARITPASWMQA
jgi:hypothetical protein